MARKEIGQSRDRAAALDPGVISSPHAFRPRLDLLLLSAMAVRNDRKDMKMSDSRFARVFDASLPNVASPVRISSFFDAQVFVRRWAIRDKDPAVRAHLRRMEKANSSEAAVSAIEELKRELTRRGLLPETLVRT